MEIFRYNAMKYLWAALLCFFLLISGSLRAQDLRSYRIRQIQDAIREKLHPSSSSPLARVKGGETPQASREVKISTGYPESEVDAAVNPMDTLNIVVGAMDLGAAGLTFPIYYTKNFGTTWSKSSFRPTPYESNAIVTGGGDPVFAYDANGKVYFSWIDLYSAGLRDSSGWYFDTLNTNMYWVSSTNGGQTWQRPVKGYIGNGFTAITENPSTGQFNLDTTTGFDDKEWIAVDRSNSPYHNTLYVAWTHLTQNNGDYGITVRRKLPGIDSMEPPVRVSSDTFTTVQFTSLGVDAGGGLHVTFMGTYDGSNYGLYHAYSSDAGKSFRPPVKIADLDIPGMSQDAIANGDTIFGLRQQGSFPSPNLTIDTANSGNLYEVWDALGATMDKQHGAGIYFSRSTDNGTTWSNPTIVNNDTVTGYTDHFLPNLAVNGKGMISVTWYDRREDAGNQIGRYYIAQSTDQGHTWTNAPVATQPMDFNFVMNVNGNFGIGEYTQVLSTPNYTIPIWTDGRDNAGQLRIYSAFINPANSRVDRLSSVGEGFSLLTNYPNPFNASTRLGFTLESAAHARLFVTNIAGERVANLFDGEAQAGEHDFTFDGSRLSNGVYYLNFETDLGISHSAITVLR